MAVTGKTGADAIFRAVHKIAQMILKYNVKLRAVIGAAETAGVITSVEALAANQFLDSITSAATVFEKVAGYSGF